MKLGVFLLLMPKFVMLLPEQLCISEPQTAPRFSSDLLVLVIHKERLNLILPCSALPIYPRGPELPAMDYSGITHR